MSILPARIIIDNTFGAGFIGIIVTAMLYGITTLQTYFYFVSYPKDSVENKILVSVIWFLDTLHVAFATFSIYHYLVTNYSNPIALEIGHWSLFVSVALNIIIAFHVQCFFTLRVFRLCVNRWRWIVASVISLAVLAHIAFGMETVAFFFIKKKFSRLSEVTLFAALPFAVFAVLSDILIALALCILLHGSRTGIKKTNTLLTTLIIYAINRCLLTSAVAVAEVITFAVAPHSLWFLAIDFIIGKLYANSLLAHLNSRQVIRSRGPSINSLYVSDIEFDSPGRTTGQSSNGHVFELRSGNVSHSSGSRSTRTIHDDDSRGNVSKAEQLDLSNSELKAVNIV